ncbi:PLP-dependent aminotransferase family protein [Fodinicola acaciae]|uniref:MocR-like pyridoxine biosynthesis transcription factor PdxR n=1 Tax=Fodinicola acaciae TaxID=2681555 RepID=UPI0013D786D9|nr:PLP-dependent aminotransferase family protein [Fodinicola acaciae]
MRRNWSTLHELLLPMAAGQPGGPPDQPRYQRPGRALEDQLRGMVRAGRLHPGARLPSTRDLAGQLGLARGTVSTAYAQLIAEGFLDARRGAGTFVAAVTPDAKDARHAPEAGLPRRFDLTPGLPSLAEFPRTAWTRAARAALSTLADDQLGYPPPAGLLSVRAELAAYLGRVRAVSATTDQVVVTHGTIDSLATLASELRGDGHRRIAVEDPANPHVLRTLTLHGLTPVPVPVDRHGIQVDQLPDCRLALVTAAHQYPLGVALSPARRRSIIDWARRRDGLVIEDDYDSEYRYDRPALTPLQALAPDRVVYLGTSSKTLAPAIRLGWLVAPGPLADAIAERKRLTDRGASALLQATFGELLRTGGYDRHLRRTRPIYRRRRDAFLAAVAKELPGWKPAGIAAGMHVVLNLPQKLDDTTIAEQLAAQGIHLDPLSHHVQKLPRPPGLVCGYAGLTEDRLRAAVADIARCVRNQAPLH